MAEEIQVVVVTPNIPSLEMVIEAEAVAVYDEAEAVAVYDEAEAVNDHEDNTDCCQTYVEHPLQCCFLTCFVCVVLFVFVYEVMRQRE